MRKLSNTEVELKKSVAYNENGLFEKIVYGQMTDYLAQCDILQKQQPGCRTKHSL